jgi:hypothetical protein
MDSKNVPKQLRNPDFEELKNVCEKYIKSTIKYGSDCKDYYAHYIFVTAIEVLYGKDIWNFIYPTDPII